VLFLSDFLHLLRHFRREGDRHGLGVAHRIYSGVACYYLILHA
jgi:hypothetical protein